MTALVPVPLETARFGIACARLDPGMCDPVVALREARDIGYRFLSTRVGTDDLAHVRALEEVGFRLMDTLIYWGRPLADFPPARPVSDGIILRIATPADAADVERVARAGFTGYIGHYHADPRLDPLAATEAYVEWAVTSTARTGATAPVLVAEMEGRVAAFLTTRRTDGLEMEAVLSAADPSMQSRGIYSALLGMAFRDAARDGIARAFTSTQVNNVAVQRVWARMGFVPERSYHTLHLWLD